MWPARPNITRRPKGGVVFIISFACSDSVNEQAPVSRERARATRLIRPINRRVYTAL